MKTIREIADELGVSKQTINYHIKKSLSPNMYQKTDKGMIMIKANGIGILREILTNKELYTNRQTTAKQPPKENSAFWQSQLEQKDKQIEQLQKLLEQQQVLQLNTQKQLDQLQLELKSDIKEGVEEKEALNEPLGKSKKWWNFW